jgi:hypothetical protein
MSGPREWCRPNGERRTFSRNCPQLQIRAVERRVILEPGAVALGSSVALFA